MNAEHIHHDQTSTRQQFASVGSFDSFQLDQLSLQDDSPHTSSCRNLSNSPSKRYKSGEFSPTLLDKKAAKTAAEYYGDCFTQGVDFESAEYIAKQAHDVYKKHWLQDSSLDYPMVTSLGDSIAVPRYGPLNAPRLEDGSPNASQYVFGHNLRLQENKVIDPRINSNYYTVKDYEYTGPSMPRNIGGSAKETASVTLHDEMKRLEYENELFFRSHNFKRANQITSSPVDANGRLRNDNLSFTLEERSKRKRQLELPQEMESSVLNCSQSSFSTAETEWHSNVKRNDRVYIREISLKNKNEIHLEHMTAFEREKIKRKQLDRRGSSYQDYWDDGFVSDNDSQSDIEEDYNECSQHHYLGCDDTKLTAILTSPSPPPTTGVAKTIDDAKGALIIALTVSSGDVTSKSFLSALEQLRSIYRNTGWDARDYNRQNANLTSKYIEGNWLSLSRPNYTECLGTNANNEFMYTLGRMSFDMFTPGNLVCSIGAVFNSIDVIDIHKGYSSLKSVPKSLKNDILNDNCLLRRYDIITALNIEPYSPLFGSNSPNKAIHKPIRGSIRTYGYVLPDPEVPNRLSIWFSGGRIEPNVEDRDGLDQWKKAFSVGTSKRPWQDKARVIAAKLLLGANIPDHMNEDGSMEYDLARPIGGHGSTYVDVLYLDESLRIVQGHKGSIFVMTRVSK